MKILANTTSIMAATFNRLIKHMQEHECCFITAYRHECTSKENKTRNYNLKQKIVQSGLSYINSIGGYSEYDANTNEDVTVKEWTFFVINNRYSAEDFLNLAISWCREFDQEAVLVTIPDRVNRGNTYKGQLRGIIGRYYDGQGNITMEFNGVTTKVVEDYFTSIGDRKFVFTSTGVYCSTQDRNFTTAGMYLARKEFKERYPNIAEKRRNRHG